MSVLSGWYFKPSLSSDYFQRLKQAHHGLTWEGWKRASVPWRWTESFQLLWMSLRHPACAQAAQTLGFSSARNKLSPAITWGIRSTTKTTMQDCLVKTLPTQRNHGAYNLFSPGACSGKITRPSDEVRERWSWKLGGVGQRRHCHWVCGGRNGHIWYLEMIYWGA